MMTMPATRISQGKDSRTREPRVVATAPSEMNTTENPRMNIRELTRTTRRRWLLSCACSSSTPTPEMSETYPGTSGSTQGERNDTSPAKNAAMGRGRLDTTLRFYKLRVRRGPDLKVRAGPENRCAARREA